ncbi:MAG TPA: DNA primase small subunit PriS [Methanomassiliicoccales archaeon]|nr:DNA primase small subunit PriS [Methanomassiliicoccales archaeon]
MNREIEFAMDLFREYYRRSPPPAPADLRDREFGFMFFDRDFVRRHMGFLEENDYRRFLVNQVPSHAYFSSALYQRPSAPTMDLKGWKGADLIFDLDADHIRGAEGLSYEDMLILVKKEAMSLVDRYIFGEFGFDEKYVRISFSGGRGYHVHVRDPRVRTLGSHERGEIIDFVGGTDLDLDSLFPSTAIMKKDFKEKVKVERAYRVPGKDEGGWRRFGRGVMEKVASEVGAMSNKGLRERYPPLRTAKDATLDDMRRSLHGKRGESTGLDLMMREDSLEYFTSDRVKELFIQMVLQSLKERMAGQIDEPVTRDVKRLIRLPGSLHGKTGLKVVTLTRDQMNDFDPLRDAVPGSLPDRTVKVVLKERLDTHIKDFQVRGEGTMEVPAYAALFLVLRRWAVLG